MRGDVVIEDYLRGLVPRTQRNAEYCAAEPGPIVMTRSRLRAAALRTMLRIAGMLLRVRDTRDVT